MEISNGMVGREWREMVFFSKALRVVGLSGEERGASRFTATRPDFPIGVY